jgi:putative ABC transport system ATP-binding protein
MAVLKLEKITYTLPNGQDLFADLSCQLDSGNGVLVYGPTGSGKTTLTKILLGIKRHYQGQFEYRNHFKTGDSRAKLTAMRREIGFMLQEPLVLEQYNLIENISLYLKLSKTRLEHKKMLEQLYYLKLGGMQRKPLSSLSWGQIRSIEMLRIVLKSPPLVICDQPFAALDPERMLWMRDQLMSLINSGSAVVVTYSLPEVRAMFDWPEIKLKE